MQFIRIILICALMLRTVDTRHYTRTLTVTNGGSWGTWGERVYCPFRTFAVGYKLKIEPYQRRGDDTGLNNVALICSDGTVIEGSANSRMWGYWTETKLCNLHDYLVSFKLKVESSQGRSGDDTAANSVKFKCRQNYTNHVSDLVASSRMEGSWGTWGDWSDHCSSYRAICGLQIKFENHRRFIDDTAMNDVKFFCCSLYRWRRSVY